MLLEIWRAIAEEITGSPLNFAAEVVQFLVLVAIFWVVAFGFGTRRGFLRNMLSERRDKLQGDIADALEAPDELATARTDASAKVAAAHAEAERLLAEATSAAEVAEATARQAADTEGARILERAQAAIANERTQLTADLRDELIGLVSEATRTVMNEALTVAEQRERIEAAIVASAGEPEGHPERVAAASAKGA